jgi:hypothetical protein
MDAILKKKLQVPYYVSSEAKDLCNKVGKTFSNTPAYML